MEELAADIMQFIGMSRLTHKPKIQILHIAGITYLIMKFQLLQKTLYVLQKQAYCFMRELKGELDENLVLYHIVSKLTKNIL